jgi:hypothetical protein
MNEATNWEGWPGNLRIEKYDQCRDEGRDCFSLFYPVPGVRFAQAGKTPSFSSCPSNWKRYETRRSFPTALEIDTRTLRQSFSSIENS